MAIGSRLVYRKGIDLVVAAVPKICARKFGPDLAFSVDFLVGGDGPKRILFEEMIEQHHLQVMMHKLSGTSIKLLPIVAL